MLKGAYTLLAFSVWSIYAASQRLSRLPGSRARSFLPFNYRQTTKQKQLLPVYVNECGGRRSWYLNIGDENFLARIFCLGYMINETFHEYIQTRKTDVRL